MGLKKKYDYIIFFDTEFISAKRKKQPIEISFIAYKINKNELIYQQTFTTYIRLQKGVFLNQYVKAFTGITGEMLKDYGIPIHEARLQFIDFIAKFGLDNFILAGWDITNDKVMIDHLLNYEDQTLEVSDFVWYDVSNPYIAFHYKDMPTRPSLSYACEECGYNVENYHNSYDDAIATKLVMEKLMNEVGIGVLFQPRFLTRETNTNKKKVVKV